MIQKTLKDLSQVKIGQNAQENWDLIDESHTSWYWFHLKSFPSSHVVLCCDDPSQNNLVEAATYCKTSTKYKNVPNIKISYCQIENIRKADQVGSVTFVSKRRVKEIKL